jgi:hypothetical protein
MNPLEFILGILSLYFLWAGKIVEFLIVVIIWLLMIIHNWFGG